MEPFRDDLEAALRRQQELERQNAELKEQLEQALHPPAPPTPTPPTNVAPTNRWIFPALAATVALSGAISYVVAAHPTVQEAPLPSASTPPPPASAVTHVDFVQPATAPAKDPWVTVPLPVKVPLYALAAGVDLTYAAGAKGTVLRRHQGEDVWSQESTGTDVNLYGLAIQLEHVIAVGERGTIVDLPSQTAKEFRAVASGTKETLRDVVFSSRGAIAVGDHGTILVGMAGRWTAETSETTDTLRAACAGLQTIFVVGDHGTVLRRDASGWLREESGTTADLRGVSCDDHKVVAVGAGGVVLVRDDPRAGFKSQTMGGSDLSSVDAYYGTSSWIAVGRGAARQRGMGATDTAGLHGDLHAVSQSSMGTCVAGDEGLFLGAHAP